MNQTKAGFTLIEILVVVLIIAVLTAVALPQYQKAVEKSRAAQGIATLKVLYEAGKVYYLEHGVYPSKFTDLEVQLPCEGNERWTTQVNADSACSIGEWSFQTYNSTSKGIFAGRIKGKYAGTGFIMWYKGVSPMGQVLCAERYRSGVTFADHTVGDYCVNLYKGTKTQGGTMSVFDISL